jgi:hypothetical protein
MDNSIQVLERHIELIPINFNKLKKRNKKPERNQNRSIPRITSGAR